MATESEAFAASSVQNAANIANTLIKRGITPKPAYNITQEDIDELKYHSKEQTNERLYQVSPRSAHTFYDNKALTDRGDITSIRLLNSNNLLQGKNNTDSRYNNSLTGDFSAYTDLIGLSNNSRGYDRFLLTDFNVAYSEKTQIMTTFGDNEVVYYFGKNPVIMNLSGLVLDSLTNNWFGNFINLYQTFLRGTQLAKNFEMLEIVLPNMRVIGSILSLSHQQNSARDTDIPFSMQFYAKEILMIPQPTLGVYGYTQQPLSSHGIFNGGNRQSQGAGLPQLGTGNTSKVGTTGGFAEPTWLSNPGSITAASNNLQFGADWFRNNITSPVVSVIATLTKIIQIVSKDITSIVLAFTNPLNAILSDIMNVAVQSTAVANLIEANVGDIARNIGTVSINLRNTISSLKNTAGVITRLPQSVSDAFKNNVHHGRIGSSAAVLSSGKKNITKVAVLNSGAPYSIQNSFTI
jgi:hypothetical protein